MVINLETMGGAKMKRPYLRFWDRQLIYADTVTGALKMLNFRWMQFERELLKTKLFKFIKWVSRH